MKTAKKAIVAIVILAMTAGSAAAAPQGAGGGNHDHQPGGTSGITRPGTPGGMPRSPGGTGNMRKDGNFPHGLGQQPGMHRNDGFGRTDGRNDRTGTSPRPDDRRGPGYAPGYGPGHQNGRNDRMGPPPRPDDRRGNYGYGPGYGPGYQNGGYYQPPVVYGGGVPYAAAPYYYDGWYGRNRDSDDAGKIILGVIGALVLGGLLSNMTANSAN